MSEYNFLKTGADLPEDDCGLTGEEIACVVTPVITYMKKTMNICDIYTAHSGRSTIHPKDIEYCLKYVAVNFENMLGTKELQQQMKTTFAEIVQDMDGYDDVDDMTADEKETFRKNGFKRSVEQLFVHFRNSGMEHNEAAAKSIELATRGMKAETEEQFCKSLCPCSLCTSVNEHFKSWESWEPKTVHEQNIYKAILQMEQGLNQ